MNEENNREEAHEQNAGNTHAVDGIVNETSGGQHPEILNYSETSHSGKIDTIAMEVHHHPHVEKKNFKEYLLEGLMIFVAVTMGFIAETIRETITEHERAEVFAASMLKDLEKDTAELNNYKTYMNFAAYKADTLIQLLSADDISNIETGKLYWYGLFGGARRLFVPDDATFQQMKSSGALRYFTSNNLSSQVAQYDQVCRKWKASEDLNTDVYVEVRKARAKIFTFKYNAAANNLTHASNFNTINQQEVDSFIHTKPPLLSYDKTNINEYVEMVRSRFMHVSVNYCDTAYSRAVTLIETLKTEYHLKDE